jgi:hypothetical protein
VSRGDYIAATLRARDLPSDTTLFRAKGGGYMIDLFSVCTNEWMTVWRVQDHVRRCGLLVHRDTVRSALDDLVKNGFLEKNAASPGARGVAATYRRKLTPAQRDHQRQQMAKAMKTMMQRAKALA